MVNKDSKALKILKKYQKIIWPEINSYLRDPKYPKHFNIPPEYDKYNALHWKTIKEYPSRKGKYLRPTLLMLSAQSMGVEKEKIIKTASAMQISEDWILIHDDIQDKSILRRGGKSLHELYSPDLAINAGDALHIIMWKVLAENIKTLGLDKSWDIYTEFYRMLMRTAMGQSAELMFMQKPVEQFTESDWVFIASSKTGYYSMAGPMRLGAIIADASQEQLVNLSEFGLHLGICFQLIDDILDIKSDFSGLKQKGNDIYEGKRTLLLSHVINTANNSDKKKIINIINKPRQKINKNEVDFVIDQMNKLGTIEYAMNKANKYKTKALNTLDNKLKFLKKNPYREDLFTLAQFVVDRKF